MKSNIVIIITLLTLMMMSCKNEIVKPQSAEYNIQVKNVVTSQYDNLPRPFQLETNTTYRIVSENSSELNSFYMGDSSVVNGKKIYGIYSAQPKSNYQGIPLIYNMELKKSILEIKYIIGGVYSATFVAGAAGNDGEDVVFNTKNDQITVYPFIAASSEKGTPTTGGMAIHAFDKSETVKWLCDASTGWIQIQYKEARVYNSYGLLTALSMPENDPKSWTFMGSNDGNLWTTLDTQTDQLLPARRTKYSYSFTNTTPYSFYKFDFTNNNGGTQLQIGEIYFENK